MDAKSKRIDEARGEETQREEGRRHFLIANVAYALWQERQRRNLPDDPNADWFTAKELLQDLESRQAELRVRAA